MDAAIEEVLSSQYGYTRTQCFPSCNFRIMFVQDAHHVAEVEARRSCSKFVRHLGQWMI